MWACHVVHTAGHGAELGWVCDLEVSVDLLLFPGLLGPVTPSSPLSLFVGSLVKAGLGQSPCRQLFLARGRLPVVSMPSSWVSQSLAAFSPLSH